MEHQRKRLATKSRPLATACRWLLLLLQNVIATAATLLMRFHSGSVTLPCCANSCNIPARSPGGVRVKEANTKASLTLTTVHDCMNLPPAQVLLTAGLRRQQDGVATPPRRSPGYARYSHPTRH